MHPLVARVAANLRQLALLPAGEGLLVAVSGGVDSMVLLRVLHALAPSQGWQLVVAHYNHRLRGVDSDRDALFVRRTAQRMGLKCVVEGGDVRGLALVRGWSVEMAARELRHEFLARTAARLGINFVALAHHADDQVELFFLRLLRGAGSGLAGMKARGISPAGKSVVLIRPLLQEPKAALLAFAQEERIRFREDASNASGDILRNRVRCELLPLLRRRYQSGLERTILRTMEIVGDEAQFAQEAARKWRLGKKREPFASLSVAVQRQCICLELTRLKLCTDFELVERLRLQPSVKHSWQDGWLLRDRRTGEVSRHPVTPVECSRDMSQLELRSARGVVPFDGVEVQWQIRARRAQTSVNRVNRRERFDAEKVGPLVRLRHWQPGDRFQPSGMAQPVKLQNLFINAKIPKSVRQRLLVAEATDGRIFWVEGLRISEPFKLDVTTRSELVWRWSRRGV